ncbi:hypothetical protein [Amycolatopsis panacis]|uniref:hypothetical protein n=1 Tax=Amycolatopsis panacis TaxID=2340917 RepID=UPI0011C44B4D|nr:hypothetical protein [Amycolatopsis panacis]
MPPDLPRSEPGEKTLPDNLHAQLTKTEKLHVTEFAKVAREIFASVDVHLDDMVLASLKAVEAESVVLELHKRESTDRKPANPVETSTLKKYVHKNDGAATEDLSVLYREYSATTLAAGASEVAWTALGASVLLLGGCSPKETRDVICSFMCATGCDDCVHEADRASPGGGERLLTEAKRRRAAILEKATSIHEIWSRNLILTGLMVSARAKLARPDNATSSDYATALIRMRSNLTFGEVMTARLADFGTNSFMEIHPPAPWRRPPGYLDTLGLCAAMAHDIVDFASDELEMEMLNLAAHTELEHLKGGYGTAGQFVTDIMVGSPSVAAAAGAQGADDALRVPYGVVAWMFGTGRYNAWEQIADIDGLHLSPRTGNRTFLSTLHSTCANVVDDAVSSMPSADAIVSLLTAGDVTPQTTGGLTSWRHAHMHPAQASHRLRITDRLPHRHRPRTRTCSTGNDKSERIRTGPHHAGDAGRRRRRRNPRRGCSENLPKAVHTAGSRIRSQRPLRHVQNRKPPRRRS